MKFWAVYRYAQSEWQLVRMVGTSRTSLVVSRGTYAVRAMNGANELSEPAYYNIDDISVILRL